MKKQHSFLKSLIFHLYPGVLITAFYLVTAPGVMKMGYPSQFALMLALAFVALPVMLAQMFLSGKKRYGTYRLEKVIKYENTLHPRNLILLTLGLVIWSLLIWFLTIPLQELIWERLFSWLPVWYIGGDISAYESKVFYTSIAFIILMNGFLAPITEELFFRGYLLSRMKKMGKAAPYLHAFFFSIYHLWQPHLVLTIFLAFLPLSIMIWRTNDLRLAVYSHCLLNLTGAVLLFTAV